MEDTNKNQESRKLPRICKFLQKVHPELQLYRKTIEKVERKVKMGIDKGIPTSI